MRTHQNQKGCCRSVRPMDNGGECVLKDHGVPMQKQLVEILDLMEAIVRVSKNH